MSGQSSLDCLNAFRFECPNISLQFSETLANCHFQPLLKVKNNNDVSISYNSLINSADLMSPLFTRLKVDNIIFNADYSRHLSTCFLSSLFQPQIQ